MSHTQPETVKFTRMADGDAADYQLLARYEADFHRTLPDRLIAELRKMEDDGLGGYPVSRLTHSLQSATRACQAGEEEEMIVAALLHDMGDSLAPHTHSEMAAAVLRPFVSPRTYWIIKHHGLFQMYYYAHHLGGDRHARERYRGHKWFAAAEQFCADYDQNCFDPAFQHQPLEFFIPMLRRIFARPRVSWEL